MGFGSSSSEKGHEQETAAIPPQISDLHCVGPPRHQPTTLDTAPPGANNTRQFTETEGIVTTTMMDLPGYRVVKVLGAVYGLTVRTRNWAAGLGMVLKSVAGGELRWFTTMLYSCRNDSLSRCVAETKARGGNAIICLRFDTADLGGFAQACAYGTACVVEKIEGSPAVATQLISAD
ncbi:hypothetical protein ACRE_038670 [Hapsidospora chrysogenum ATCC 11550]|uniref:Uncharacterized protein n=1 Tax=Hapsidospora chrysogenum (strain ATCC 11550 / CBS 779.69 / DSM 880 / IAM 14645 / JCM 23072 / IMI 49137) TaxID=857340 RepID=A0A086T7H5_HAPC1|nr:hypothetical protein ACRE_038670 [Hapsidospora chrysogenum ATCC 11550]